MGDPMRIRAIKKGKITEVKILIRHRMLSRLSWDNSGKLVLPHFIKTVKGVCNENLILYVHFGGSVAKDPYFSFKFKGGNKGDIVKITWIDTEDDERTDQVAIT